MVGSPRQGRWFANALGALAFGVAVFAAPVSGQIPPAESAVVQAATQGSSDSIAAFFDAVTPPVVQSSVQAMVAQVMPIDGFGQQRPLWQLIAAAALLAFLALGLILRLPSARARLGGQNSALEPISWPRLDKIVARERALRSGGAVPA